MNIANEWLMTEAKMFYNCSFCQSLLAKTMWHEVISKKRLLFTFTQVLSSKFMIFTDWQKHLHRMQETKGYKWKITDELIYLSFVLCFPHDSFLCPLKPRWLGLFANRTDLYFSKRKELGRHKIGRDSDLMSDCLC